MWIAVISVILLVFLIMMINFNFTIFKMYMKRNTKSNETLLNALHWLHASILQFGSVLILLILADKFNDKLVNLSSLNLLIPSKEFFIQIRMLHLSCVFLNIFNIGIATVMHSFKKHIYLQIGHKISKAIIYMTTMLLSILINIFARNIFKEDKIDGQLVRYQTVIQAMGLCLSLSSLLMFFCVLLIPHSVNLLQCAVKYCHYSQSSVSPSVEQMETHAIEMSEAHAHTQAESVNGEEYSNPLPDIEEYIR